MIGLEWERLILKGEMRQRLKGENRGSGRASSLRNHEILRRKWNCLSKQENKLKFDMFSNQL